MIPPTAPYSDSTLLFQQCLQKQVDKVSFHSHSDRLNLLTVTSEFHACVLSTLADFTGKPLVLEVFLSPRLIVLSITRTSQTVKTTYLPPLLIIPVMTGPEFFLMYTTDKTYIWVCVDNSWPTSLLGKAKQDTF